MLTGRDAQDGDFAESHPNAANGWAAGGEQTLQAAAGCGQASAVRSVQARLPRYHRRDAAWWPLGWLMVSVHLPFILQSVAIRFAPITSCTGNHVSATRPRVAEEGRP